MTMASVAGSPPRATRPRIEVSENESLQLTKNLLRIAMSNISYIRGFFPESFYREKFVAALDMEVNKLLPMDVESKRFIDWLEKGVFDALEKKYLRTLFLTICRGEDGPLIEEYSFSFKYAAEGASENISSMIIESSSGKPVHTDTKNQTSPLQMKQSACKMVRTLVQLMYTLDEVPSERTIAMRLHYYDDITPENYEPPFFVSSTDEDGGEDPNPWDQKPLKMKVGRVDGRHYKLAIEVKSVLDPCDDGNDLAEDETCSVDLMLTSDDDSSACDDDSSISPEVMVVNTPSSQPYSQPSKPCRPCQPIPKVLPRMDTPIQASENKEQVQVLFEETALAVTFKQMQSTAEAAENGDTDKTEHPVFEAKRLRTSSRFQKREEIATHMNGITNKFPQLLKIESGCRVYQIQEGTRSNGTQQCRELKTRSPPTDAKTNMISEAENVSDNRVADDVKQRLYEMALLHTLPREYVTMKQLQEALDVSSARVQKLIVQMCRDGYIENPPKVKRKGRRVFHTPEADKKLQELRAIFDSKMREGNKIMIEPGCRVYQLQEGTKSNGTQQYRELNTRPPPTNAKTNMISEAEDVSDDRVADDAKQRLYEMALLHTLPREYVTMKQLQEALDVSSARVQKLIVQMYRDGYIENSPKVKWKGRRVFHTPEADKKLQELRAVFDSRMRKNKKAKTSNCDNRDSPQPWEGLISRNRTYSILPNIRKDEQSKALDESVCGRMRALGSDITRQRLRIHQEHSSANNRHTKAIPTFQEPPVPQKAVQEQAKASALSEQPNVTSPTLGYKRKRVRFHDSDSRDDIDEDCALHHLKARKPSQVDGALYQSPLKRSRAKKLPGVVPKGNHSSPAGDDPYHFHAEGPEKSAKRKFRGNDMSHQDSLEEWPTTNSCNSFNSFYESDDRVVTLKSRDPERTRLSFIQTENVLKRCPRPAVYARRARAG